MNIKSINTRLIALYTSLILIISVIYAIYTYQSTAHYLQRMVEQLTSIRIAKFEANVLPNISLKSASEFKKQIDDVYTPENRNWFIRLTRGDGVILYVSGVPANLSFDPALIPPVQNHTTPKFSYIYHPSSSSDFQIFVVNTSYSEENYTIEMGFSLDEINDILYNLALTLMLGIPVLVAISIVGGGILVRHALKPIELIRKTATHITQNNLRQRLPVPPTGDSIQNLTITLNQMLERLESAYNQAKRFSGDASHELRTPLSVMRGELESWLVYLEAGEMPPNLQEGVESSLEEVIHMSKIISSLLSIVQFDTDIIHMERTTCNLSVLVHSVIDQMNLLAAVKNISIEIDASQEVIVYMNVSHLKQIFINVLDNAIKYTHEGGTIHISISQSGGKAILKIEDNGIGIAATALPHIFERFYRDEKTRLSGIRGTGLGLAIVRAICEAYGGSIHIASVECVGTCVTIKMPLAVDEISNQ